MYYKELRVLEEYGLKIKYHNDKMVDIVPIQFDKPENIENGKIIIIPEYQVIRLWLDSNKITLSVWEYTPGPGKDDFIIELNNINCCIEIIKNYYFGKPTIIDNWAFPFNKHPELNKDNIPYILQNLVNINENDFVRIKEGRFNKVKGKFWIKRWDKALFYHFLCIENIEDMDIYLGLRRDMQEFYIVHKNNNYY